MGIQDVDIVGHRPEYALELVKMWRQSFQRAMGLPEQNRSDDLIGQLDYFCTIDPAAIQVAIDTSSSTIAGFSVLQAGELDHLYVNVRYQGQGLGSKLLYDAKSRAPNGVKLYTFQKNTRAQAFYLSHGFVELERGFADFEGNPWASSKEELADIRYGWTP
ncbi:MAG: GNAT family N-acetyltransferase [Pseudomonadota bacterium]